MYARETCCEGKLALRPREAAAMLSISPRTLYTLTRSGQIRAVRLSGSKQGGLLYPRNELERFLSERLSNSESAEPLDNERGSRC